MGIILSSCETLAKLLTAGAVRPAPGGAVRLPPAVVHAQAPAPRTGRRQPQAPEPAHLPGQRRSRDDRRHRARSEERSVRRRSQTGEFEVYEDGVKQEIVSLVLTHGGRVYNVQSPPPAPVQEGIILPRNRPTNDAAGRVFLLFIDDLHLDFRSTPRTRDLIKRMLRAADPRGRHVRHRHAPGLVDLGAADLRPPGPRVGDLARHRRRPEAEGDHRGHAGRRRGRPNCGIARTWRSRPPTT